MRDELLTSLGIDTDLDLKSMLEALEEKQFEYLERLETVSDENRKQELTEVLHCIDEEITSVKEQLKDIRSSLILDTEQEMGVADAPVEVKKEEKSEAKKTTGKKDAEKVKQMKEKASKEQKEKPAVTPEKQPEKDEAKAEPKEKKQEKQEKPEKQVKKEVPEPKMDLSAKKHTVSSPSAPAKEVKNDSLVFLNGLVEYKKQNYEECFKIVKELGEKGDSSSQYLLALMYLDGLGVPKDTERSAFWMQKSAEAGETAAQFMYGAMLIEKSGGNQKKLKDGFRYLCLAAEKNDADAQRKYVEETLKQPVDRKRIKKAMVFCDKLKNATNDSFNKKEMDDKKQKLREKKKKEKVKSPGKKKKKVFRWIFLLLLIVGAVFGFKHKEEIMEWLDAYRAETKVSEEERPDLSSEVEEPEDTKETEKEPEPMEIRARMTAQNGNIRSGASTDYESLTRKPQGTELVLTGREEIEPNSGGIWYEVKLEDGTIGWVHQTIIEIIE